MHRARFLCLLGSMSALALAIPAMISLADPAVKGPEPQDVTADDKGEATGNHATPDAKAEKPDDTTTPRNGEKKAVPAKQLFGTKLTAAALAPRAIGSYARGCLAGAQRLPADGPNWQAMRLSRNRTWGHPDLIALLKRFANDAKEKDGWPGLLVGDIAQPRGGPMKTGHASHQVGLDADIWLTPMPDRTLTAKERENIAATSMLDKTSLAVDPNIFTARQVALIKRAASYHEVERIFVHPAIKKALCEAAGNDRTWLAKVRPMWGHYYHFHIRISCPNEGCQTQAPVSGDDGCGKEIQQWLKVIEASLKPVPSPRKEAAKPSKPKPPITMADLPSACQAVLDSPETKTVSGTAIDRRPHAAND